MATATLDRPRKKPAKNPLADVENLAELLDRLGNIPLERIRFQPTPGTATEKDVILSQRTLEKGRCELIDGVLVVKPMGTKEALWAGLILHYLWNFLEKHDLGLPLGADAYTRLFPGRVRIPDGSFFSWETLGGDKFPDEAIASIVPDWALEVLSPGNTPKEMDRKLDDYFKAGVKLVWIVDPEKQTAEVYTACDKMTPIKKNGILSGGTVLPGFAVSLKKLFAPRGKKKPKS